MNEEQAAVRVVRFGIFEFDLRARELRKGGQSLKLEAKPLQVLELLLERAGELVTREELRRRLWPDSFVEFDRCINTAVNKLRQALGDRPDSPRYIETRARLGYRFMIPTGATAFTAGQALLQPGLGEAVPAGQPVLIGVRAPESASAAWAAIVNPRLDGDAVRFQLQRADGEFAELRLRLTTTEGALNMRLDFCGHHPRSPRRPQPGHLRRLGPAPGSSQRAQRHDA